MLKRTIKYKDLDGNDLEEDFYFHYSTGEATELRITLGDNIQAKIQRLIESENTKEIVQIFKDIIADSIGRRSDNGKSFIKNQQIREEFMGSDAYSELLLWLFERTENMSNFVNGIFPANMQQRVGEIVQQRETSNKITVELPKESVPTPTIPKMSIQSPIGSQPRIKSHDVETKTFMDMTPEEFSAWKASQI